MHMILTNIIAVLFAVGFSTANKTNIASSKMYNQTFMPGDTITAEVVFNRMLKSKYGYSFADYLVQLPDSVADACQKKRTRITGTTIIHEAPKLQIINARGEKEYRQGRGESYTLLVPITIYVFGKSGWKKVYGE
jgi:hypothetical protein